ncbi:Signal transduction histidine-protein kinase AtoS [Zhongshania aliphaticivorans]|uniref:histidine kinase n=1 Tax=Zhongshania aliphaticivorans TaxID=1470434 RepID=A0A5S9Q9V2_9GAMM|nr:ATP-binding protein [Zhongshania aliphaticivorans]CAA0087013.1 Signal transduction histidine-protein kinase AtoS [Zhongshania aliphaticivorans]CAA0113908.1 Signal transduction histidine-protein kinase AtoS [Zhongshania aliphaticivorans]
MLRLSVSRRNSQGFAVQRLLALLAVVLALTVIAFLLWKTLGNPLETGLHIIRLEQLDAAENADAELNQQIARGRLSLDSGLQRIELARDRFSAAKEAISRGQASLQGLSLQIDSDLTQYDKTAADKLSQLNEYSAKLARLAQHFSIMRVAGISMLNVPAVNRSESLRENLMALLREATAYAIQSTPSNAYTLDDLARNIRAAEDQLDSDSERGALRHLLSTVDELRSTADQLQALTVQFDTIATGTALYNLRAGYEKHFNNLQATAKSYRQTLAVYAVALLLAFGVIAVRLRSSFSALDRLNSELQDANVNLEKIVDKRTQALSKALDDLKMQQGQLIQSEKMASLGQMVAGVAHEINTPLGYASSNVEIVRESLQATDEELDAESIAEFDMLLADTEFGLKQIAELVMSLKDFSRVDRSQSQLFDLNEGVDTALKICNSELKDRVKVTRAFAELPQISCAPSQLNQVFLNLITNAAQAMDGEGQIVIRTSLIDDEVEVAISDTGSGMDEETQAHIFEPFFTTKPIGKGTGLGLSIVFRIIEDHGGSIRVESEIGKGTEFIIRLPVGGNSSNADRQSTPDVVVLGDA